MKLKTVIAKVLNEPVDHITEDTSSKTLKSWNSVKHVELIMELEQIYKIQFSGAEIVSLRSYREIKNMLIKKGKDV